MKNFFFVISLMIFALGLAFWKSQQGASAQAVKAQVTEEAVNAYLDALEYAAETGAGAEGLLAAETRLIWALRHQFPNEEKFQTWSTAPGLRLTNPAAQSIARFRANFLDGEVGP